MSNFYGLIGGKLGHSLSPEIHGDILSKLKLPGTYSLFEVAPENLQDAVRGLRALGCRGVNVTIPYKIDIMAYLDKISAEAERIGAVNTISFKNGILTGYNTDYTGFGYTMKRADILIPGSKAVLLGTGGAARAVLQYFADNGASEVTIVSRNPDKAIISGDHKVISYADLNNLDNGDLIINCTPCGMFPENNQCPVSKSILEKFSAAVDLIYNPIETVFVKNAREAGLKSVNGLFMLTAQAAVAQEIWQGIKLSEQFLEELYLSVKEVL